MQNGNTTHIKLPADLHKSLKAEAKREQRTMHNLILVLLRQSLSARGGK